MRPETTCPTLKEVVLHALHTARLDLVERSGREDVAAVVPAIGVCCIINEDGPMLDREHLPMVEETLQELTVEGAIQRTKSPHGVGYFVVPNSPKGRSAVVEERPPFGRPCHEDTPLGGDARCPR